MGLVAFKKCQVAIEATHGDATTCDKMLVGSMGYNSEVTFNAPEEDTGLLSKVTRRTKIDEKTSLSYEGSATFEQLMLWLGCAFKGGVTPTDVGDGAYEWLYNPNLTAVNDPETFHLIAGDDVEQYSIPYCVLQNIEISMALGDVAKLRADMIGRPMSATSFETITLPTVEDIVAAKMTLDIDATWAGLGDTAVTAMLTSAAMRFPTGLVPVKYADGTQYFSDVAENKRSMELDLTYLHSTTAVTEWGYLAAGTRRFIRLEVLGSLIGGSNYNLLRIDVCGTYESWSKPGDKDGETVTTIKLTSEYDPTSTKEYNVMVRNSKGTYAA